MKKKIACENACQRSQLRMGQCDEEEGAQAGPITCGKPIMQSTVPSLCNIHFQKAQKHVTRALKKAGLNVSSNKLAPKFHAIVAEYVREIQGKRRAELTAHRNKIVAKHARGS
ncbi:unnamed protein product [Ilex paraguariensis]|uniref:KAT8 regulatory NSL complex subunit 2 n=1 Tax=Ilex paraguariensis TaxID=185542 RepID=A0ABC8ULP4_9AQUA